MFFKNLGTNRVGLSGQVKKILGGFIRGVNSDDVAIVGQVIGVDTSGNVTSNNTFTGTNTFSNASGVTTDRLTPNTSGAGTSIMAPVAEWTLNVSPAVTASGTTYYANAATTTVANTMTLPACAAASIGTTYKVKVIKAVTVGGTYVINTTGTDVFIGSFYGSIAAPNATNDALFAVTTVNKTMTLTATTACGLVGTWFEFTMISATQWSVTGMGIGTGTIVTPFSN